MDNTSPEQQVLAVPGVGGDQQHQVDEIVDAVRRTSVMAAPAPSDAPENPQTSGGGEASSISRMPAAGRGIALPGIGRGIKLRPTGKAAPTAGAGRARPPPPPPPTRPTPKPKPATSQPIVEPTISSASSPPPRSKAKFQYAPLPSQAPAVPTQHDQDKQPRAPATAESVASETIPQSAHPVTAPAVAIEPETHASTPAAQPAPSPTAVAAQPATAAQPLAHTHVPAAAHKHTPVRAQSAVAAVDTHFDLDQKLKAEELFLPNEGEANAEFDMNLLSSLSMTDSLLKSGFSLAWSKFSSQKQEAAGTGAIASSVHASSPVVNPLQPLPQHKTSHFWGLDLFHVIESHEIKEEKKTFSLLEKGTYTEKSEETPAAEEFSCHVVNGVLSDLMRRLAQSSALSVSSNSPTSSSTAALITGPSQGGGSNTFGIAMHAFANGVERIMMIPQPDGVMRKIQCRFVIERGIYQITNRGHLSVEDRHVLTPSPDTFEEMKAIYDSKYDIVFDTDIRKHVYEILVRKKSSLFANTDDQFDTMFLNMIGSGDGFAKASKHKKELEGAAQVVESKFKGTLPAAAAAMLDIEVRPVTTGSQKGFLLERDWSAEYFEICRLPALNAHAYKRKGARYQTLLRDFIEFCEAQTRLILEDISLPVNLRLLVPETEHDPFCIKFVHGNVVFKVMQDMQALLGFCDSNAHKIASNELRAANALNCLSIPRILYHSSVLGNELHYAPSLGMHTPLEVMLYYGGHAILATALVNAPSAFVYGSEHTDKAAKNSDVRMDSFMEAAGKQLNLRRHAVNGQWLYGPGDMHGRRLKGDFGEAYYVENLSRLLPVFPPSSPSDFWYQPGEHLFKVFRPEFISAYRNARFSSDVFSGWGCIEAADNLALANSQLPPNAGKMTAAPGDVEGDWRVHNADASAAESHFLNVTLTSVRDSLLKFTDSELQAAAPTAGGSSRSKEEVLVGIFNALVPAFHSKGVNLRFLSVIRDRVSHSTALVSGAPLLSVALLADVLLFEMIARVTKIRLRKLQRNIEARNDRDHGRVVQLMVQVICGKDDDDTNALVQDPKVAEIAKFYWSSVLLVDLQQKYDITITKQLQDDLVRVREAAQTSSAYLQRLLSVLSIKASPTSLPSASFVPVFPLSSLLLSPSVKVKYCPVAPFVSPFVPETVILRELEKIEARFGSNHINLLPTLYELLKLYLEPLMFSSSSANHQPLVFANQGNATASPRKERSLFEKAKSTLDRIILIRNHSTTGQPNESPGMSVDLLWIAGKTYEYFGWLDRAFDFYTKAQHAMSRDQTASIAAGTSLSVNPQLALARLLLLRGMVEKAGGILSRQEQRLTARQQQLMESRDENAATVSHDIESELWKIHLDQCRVLIEEENFEGASTQIAKCLELLPDEQDPRRILPLLISSRVLRATSMSAKAFEVCHEASVLADDRGDMVLLAMIQQEQGRLHLAQGDVHEAIRIWKMALALHPAASQPTPANIPFLLSCCSDLALNDPEFVKVWRGLDVPLAELPLGQSANTVQYMALLNRLWTLNTKQPYIEIARSWLRLADFLKGYVLSSTPTVASSEASSHPLDSYPGQIFNRALDLYKLCLQDNSKEFLLESVKLYQRRQQWASAEAAYQKLLPMLEEEAKAVLQAKDAEETKADFLFEDDKAEHEAQKQAQRKALQAAKYQSLIWLFLGYANVLESIPDKSEEPTLARAFDLAAQHCTVTVNAHQLAEVADKYGKYCLLHGRVDKARRLFQVAVKYRGHEQPKTEDEVISLGISLFHLAHVTYVLHNHKFEHGDQVGDVPVAGEATITTATSSTTSTATTNVAGHSAPDTPVAGLSQLAQQLLTPATDEKQDLLQMLLESSSMMNQAVELFAVLSKNASAAHLAQRAKQELIKIGNAIKTQQGEDGIPESTEPPMLRGRNTSMDVKSEQVVKQFIAEKPAVKEAVGLQENEFRSVKVITRSDLEWQPDSSTKTCMQCQNKFTLIRRRHHCRVCGHVVCGRCSKNSVRLDSGKVRVCDNCFVKSLNLDAK